MPCISCTRMIGVPVRTNDHANEHSRRPDRGWRLDPETPYHYILGCRAGCTHRQIYCSVLLAIFKTWQPEAVRPGQVVAAPAAV